ncbi:MarR family winged helix-turn-helix transcriptional regulator [Mycobacterium sp. 3519A]|uniref:MarR family winged helix-turn-helix transcriptional regulator n=1 Tax=Mycobacterium sp. 3519A TaxID=2057184 RepID=UPI000C7C1263|nr:MarR family transcriptional regulator [Mycobacterium sp. 3519A]
MSSALPDGLTATSVATSVLRAARKLTLGLEAALASEKLGVDHWLALDALAASDGLTMAELQSLTLTAGPTQTRVVDKLVSQSLSYREVDAVDRRKVRVYLSERGITLHRRLVDVVGAVEAQWLASEGLPAK